MDQDQYVKEWLADSLERAGIIPEGAGAGERAAQVDGLLGAIREYSPDGEPDSLVPFNPADPAQVTALQDGGLIVLDAMHPQAEAFRDAILNNSSDLAVEIQAGIEMSQNIGSSYAQCLEQFGAASREHMQSQLGNRHAVVDIEAGETPDHGCSASVQNASATVRQV